MLFEHLMDACGACGEELPRAAVNRCPFCRSSIARPAAVGNITCRQCRGTIPRAHAGQCPHCAVRRVVGDAR